MARFGKRARKNGGGNQAPRGCAYSEIARENASFETYYRAMGVVPEGEWDAFMATLRSDLPATFRVTGHRYDAAVLRRNLSDGSLLAGLHGADCSGVAEESMLSPILWYKPEGTAWKIDAGRRQVRTDAAYKALHRWLVAASEHGDISRQEAVSMVPPLLLDVRADDIVLDMCAAPGSKTTQLIEAMHVSAGPSGAPTGAVIANDADRNRSYMLHHQVSRVLSPCLVVTNMDASSFPVVRRPDGSRVLFDRVLADVPCSGDGTLRKNVVIWKDWSPANAMGLHPLQVRILRRGIELLQPGGRLVYSTCSLNPVEDEAVVASVLADFGGAVRLVDVSAALPELKRSPGVSSWPVIAAVGPSGVERYETIDDVPAHRRRVVKPSLFARAEYASLNLERCMRILPHHSDTGGFFVAVMERVGGETAEGEAVADGAATNATKKGFTSEGDLVPLSMENAAVRSIFEHYGISAEAIAACGYGVFTRGGTEDGGRIRNVTFVSKSATPIVASASVHGRIRLVNAGVRAFEVYEPSKRQIASGIEAAQCEYRVLAEAAALLLPIMTRRVAEVSVADARRMLSSDNSVVLEDRLDDPALSAVLAGGQGGAVVYARAGPDASPLAIPAWVMAPGRIKAFIPTANRPAMLMALN